MHWDRLAHYAAPLGLIVLALGTLGVMGLLSRRRRGQYGAVPVSGDGSVSLTGTLTCPIYRRYTLGERTHTMQSGEFVLPGRIAVRCKGEGDKRRCSASYPGCPRPSPLEGEPVPAAATIGKVSGLRPPDYATRGQDNSGMWNTRVRYEGKEGWKPRGQERVRESLGLQFWDDAPDIHYDIAAFRRPYPRADLEYETDGWHMALDTKSLQQLYGLLSHAVVAGGVARAGYWVTREMMRTAPPIRVGGREIDWPREDAA